MRNSNSFWLDGVRPNLAWLAGGWDDERMDGLLLLASTVSPSAIPAAAISCSTRIGRLTRRPERTVAPFVYAGAAILSPRLFADAPDGAFSLNLLFDRAIAAGRLFGVRLDGTWINVETPQRGRRRDRGDRGERRVRPDGSAERLHHSAERPLPRHARRGAA